MTPKRGLLLAMVVTCAAAGLLVASDYAATMAQARLRIARGSEIAQTPCGPIEYAQVGSGDPVLFVRGAGGGFDQGLGLANELASRGLQVVTMSRFGYLRTPLPADASPAAQADAHACLLDALKIDRALLAGASAGAPSSVQFALRHQQRTLGLLLLVPAYAPRDEPAPPPPPGTQCLIDTALRFDFLFWAATYVARDALVELLLATPPAAVAAASADERQRVDAIIGQILPVSARRLGLLNDNAVLAALPRYDLQSIEAPALIVSVRDDGFGTWNNTRRIAAQMPQARFGGYDSGGHDWVGHHKEVLSEISAFARSVPK
jgi:2-hydroxy-6-oxonona-2,4-dienedioate hydrolase